MVTASTRFLPEEYRWILRGELPEPVDTEKKKSGRPKKVVNGVISRTRRAKTFILNPAESIVLSK